MNNKPQQPRFDPTRLGLPKDIAQVIERLKARGLVRHQPAQPATWRDTDATHKTPRKPCKWCGKEVSETFGHHLCVTKRMNLKPL